MCGCVSEADVEHAVAAGADAVGLIFAASARRITLERAVTLAAGVPALVSVVGVFVDPSEAELREAVAAIPRLQLQFSGSESPALCAGTGAPYTKVFHIAGPDDAAAVRGRIARYPGALAMFETASAGRGGSGQTFDWSLIEDVARERRVAVSGGLTPENVGACVRSVRPFAVDVRSGVESGDVKDPVKMRAFVRAVREADAEA